MCHLLIQFFRVLLFFDDGFAQYTTMDKIHLVCESGICMHAYKRIVNVSTNCVLRVQHLGGGGKTLQGVYSALPGWLPNCKSHP